jgi:hypothetical protein
MACFGWRKQNPWDPRVADLAETAGASVDGLAPRQAQ